MNHIEMLKECCRLRGLPQELMHRTLHEFNWFIDVVIFGGTSENIEERKIVLKYGNFQYDGNNTLEKEIELFYEYCKEEYEQN